MQTSTNQLGFVIIVTIFGLGSSSLVRAHDRSDDSESLTIEGAVVDPEGEPVRSGKVTVWHFEDEPSPRWESAARRDLDQNGRFTVPGLEAPGSLLVSVATEGYAPARRRLNVEYGGKQTTKITLTAPGSLTLHVLNESGQPIPDVTVRVLTIEDDNGSNSLTSVGLRDLQLFETASDDLGRLPLNGLPEGASLSVDLFHRDYAPARLTNVQADSDQQPVDIELQPGVPMTIQVKSSIADPPMGQVEIDVRHEPISHPSTLTRTFLPLDESGTAHLTLAPGKYRLLWLKHPDVLISPWYSPRTVERQFLNWETTAPRRYEFAVHRKVKIHGRAIDRMSGEPITKGWVRTEIPNVLPDGTVSPGEAEWMHAGWAQTNSTGEYTVDAAAGPVRVWFEGDGYFGDVPYREFTLDPTVGAVGPSFELTPIRPVQGQVLAPNGQPAAGVIVRFRGWHLRHLQPVVTDEQGRFVLEYRTIPVDNDTQQRVLRHPIAAFHPHLPWTAVQWVSFDDPEHSLDITIPLSAQENGDLIGMVPDDLSPWERGDVDPERLAGLLESSLIGQPSIELDGRQWLNTDNETMTLADYRGKYLFLVFWTTWCGPCHGDFPSVKLLQELYGEQGLQVIGIHDNSVDPADIAAHVKQEELTFPIVIDHTDGRIVKEFNAYGITGFPSYVLVGPDGRVLMEDRTQPSPSLRVFKLELAKQLLDSGTE